MLTCIDRRQIGLAPICRCCIMGHSSGRYWLISRAERVRARHDND